MNLLAALDALLEERSVTRAAERLRTSPAAMSRTLARLRRALGDPILVRAGQAMTMTPRAIPLREEVRSVVERSHTLLTRGDPLDLVSLSRTFTVQASDMMLAGIGSSLISAVARDAPGVTVRFAPESVEQTPALREGRVDVELGVLDHTDTETHTESLMSVGLVAAVRPGHPLARGRITPARFSKADHISVSRRGRAHGPIDDQLTETRPGAACGRRPAESHSGIADGPRRSGLVCLTPAMPGGAAVQALGLHTFPIPWTCRPGHRHGVASTQPRGPSPPVVPRPHP